MRIAKTIGFVSAAFLLWAAPAQAQDMSDTAPAMETETALGIVKHGVTHLTPVEAQTLLSRNPQARILDVRTSGEYKRGHIAGAVRAGYFSTGFRKRLGELDRNTPWIVQCKSGHRSERAVKVMKDMGFSQIYHMDGGMNAWRKADLPEETEAENRDG